MPRLSERDPYSVAKVRRRAERLGLTLHQTEPGVWGLWKPATDVDPHASRAVFLGTWSKVREHLQEVECGPWKDSPLNPRNHRKGKR